MTDEKIVEVSVIAGAGKQMPIGLMNDRQAMKRNLMKPLEVSSPVQTKI